MDREIGVAPLEDVAHVVVGAHVGQKCRIECHARAQGIEVVLITGVTEGLYFVVVQTAGGSHPLGANMEVSLSL